MADDTLNITQPLHTGEKLLRLKDNSDDTYSIATNVIAGTITANLGATDNAVLDDIALNQTDGTQVAGVKLYNTDTTTYVGLKFIDGKPRYSSMPYLYDIAEGNVTGHTAFERFGINTDIDITAEDIWPTGGNYTWPASAQQMELVSSSAEDDPDKGGATPGTGIHTVTLYYLTNDFTEKTEDINLNGTGVVTTSGSDIYRVQALKAKVVGTGGAAAGTITIRNLADTPVYSSIEIGYNRSRNTMYTVPKAKTLYVTSIFAGCSCTSGSGAVVTLKATYDHDAAAARTFFMPHAEVSLGVGAIYRPFELPLKFIAGTDIKCSAYTLANNTTVTVGLRGWLE
jgi:hypothetical protein